MEEGRGDGEEIIRKIGEMRRKKGKEKEERRGDKRGGGGREGRWRQEGRRKKGWDGEREIERME